MSNRDYSLPRHHPDEGVLLDYATGVIRRPFCAWIATHLTFCPACRTEVTRLESVGGAVIERSRPVALTPTCLDTVLARLDQAEKPCAVPDCCMGALIATPLVCRCPCVVFSVLKAAFLSGRQGRGNWVRSSMRRRVRRYFCPARPFAEGGSSASREPTGA